MTEIGQPARDRNIEAIVSYFESGIKKHSSCLGIELEHTLIKTDGSPVSYSEDHGVAWLLDQLSECLPEKTHDSQGDLVGVAKGSVAVTIEPASQVELSAGPFCDLAEADECFQAFERTLQDVLSPVGVEVHAVGYNPVAKAQDLELIPKRRYQLMNAYLGAISPFGVCMMRGSASTQISIDYTSVEDCLRKLRVAFALVPVLSLITDNAPVFEGKPRTHQLVRTEIWKYCDPDRCCTVKGVMDSSFTLADYAAYILDAPAILVPDPSAEGGWRETSRTFGEEYATTPMEKSDVEHALSMFFTDVRLKTYIEIRPADAMPIPYVLAYAALIKGLFYNEGSIRELETLFANVSEDDIAQAKESLMAEGYAGEIYGTSASDVADRIIDIALKGLDERDVPYLAPLASLVQARTTLACIA